MNSKSALGLSAAAAAAAATGALPVTPNPGLARQAGGNLVGVNVGLSVGKSDLGNQLDKAMTDALTEQRNQIKRFENMQARPDLTGDEAELLGKLETLKDNGQLSADDFELVFPKNQEAQKAGLSEKLNTLKELANRGELPAKWLGLLPSNWRSDSHELSKNLAKKYGDLVNNHELPVPLFGDVLGNHPQNSGRG